MSTEPQADAPAKKRWRWLRRLVLPLLILVLGVYLAIQLFQSDQQSVQQKSQDKTRDTQSQPPEQPQEPARAKPGKDGGKEVVPRRPGGNGHELLQPGGRDLRDFDRDWEELHKQQRP